MFFAKLPCAEYSKVTLTIVKSSYHLFQVKLQSSSLRPSQLTTYFLG